MVKRNVSELAADQLLDIYDEGIELFGETQAVVYQIELEEKIDGILEKIYRGRKRGDCQEGVLSVRHKAHFIFFREDGNNIEIIEILRCTRDLENYFESENSKEKGQDDLERKLEEDRLWREARRDRDDFDGRER